jgi:hypothetical protein
VTPSDLLVQSLTTFANDGDASAHELAASVLRELHASGATAGDDAESRARLADFVGYAAHLFASDGPPLEGARAQIWDALISTADSLNGSGVHPVGRPSFVSDKLFRRLVGEAHVQLASVSELGASRIVGRAGDALAAVAVSRQLRETVSSALGFAVKATYDALYEYDPPGSHVGTHVDANGYEIVFHLLLEHLVGAGADGRSVLIAHMPKQSSPTRITLAVGDAVVLRGRGTIHSWQPLGSDERRILIAIGFRRA